MGQADFVGLQKLLCRGESQFQESSARKDCLVADCGVGERRHAVGVEEASPFHAVSGHAKISERMLLGFNQTERLRSMLETECFLLPRICRQRNMRSGVARQDRSVDLCPDHESAREYLREWVDFSFATIQNIQCCEPINLTFETVIQMLGQHAPRADFDKATRADAGCLPNSV